MTFLKELLPAYAQIACLMSKAQENIYSKDIMHFDNPQSPILAPETLTQGL